MKNNSSSPSIEPWSTPVSMLAKGEAYPFKITHCFLKLRKSVIIFKIWSDIPFCFHLNKRPLCQTLSNTALTSRLLSKDWYASWVVERSWLIQKSTGLKPDWLSDIKLFSMKDLNILSYNNLSKILPKTGRNNTFW